MSLPFLKWVGGKRGLLPELEKRIPRFSGTYFEPFLGGGALFFHLEPRNAFLADANDELMSVYTVVREDPRAVIRELEEKRNEEKFYYEERERTPKDAVDRAARFIYLNRVCFNGLYRVNRKGKFNVPFGKYSNPDLVQAEKILCASKVLKGVDLRAQDFLYVLSLATKNDFVYLDPPYAPLSKTSSFTAFAKGGFSDVDQERLRDACLLLKQRGVPFLLSNSDAPLIRDLYSGPRFMIEAVEARRSVNSRGDRRGKISELLIS